MVFHPMPSDTNFIVVTSRFQIKHEDEDVFVSIAIVSIFILIKRIFDNFNAVLFSTETKDEFK